MQIAATPSALTPTSGARAPEASEAPGRDHDADGDEAGAVKSASPAPSAPVGMGTVADTKA